MPEVKNVDHLVNTTSSGLESCQSLRVLLNGEEFHVARVSRLDQPLYLVKASLPENAPVHVRVEGDRPLHLRPAAVHPSRLKIRVEGRWSIAEFTLPTPRQAVLCCANLAPLVLALDSEPDEPSDESWLHVEDMGVGPDPIADQTAALQSLLDRVSADPTLTTLALSRGMYRSGPLNLPASCRLFVPSGCVLRALDDPSRFMIARDAGKDRPSELLCADGVDNIAVEGHGTIDANGLTLRKHFHPMYSQRLWNCTRVRLRHLTLIDSGTWNTHVFRCASVDIDNVTLLNNLPPLGVLNTDGFDINSSQDVRIRRIFVHCGDDAIVIKSRPFEGHTAENVERVRVEDVITMNNSAAFKIGTETDGDVIREVRVSNLDAIRCARGCAIDAYDRSAITDIHISGVRLHAIGESGPRVAAIDIDIPEPGTRWRSLRGETRVSRVTIRDFQSKAHTPVRIVGRDEEHSVTDVVLEDVVTAGQCITDVDASNCEIGPHAAVKFQSAKDQRCLKGPRQQV